MGLFPWSHDKGKKGREHFQEPICKNRTTISALVHEIFAKSNFRHNAKRCQMP